MFPTGVPGLYEDIEIAGKTPCGAATNRRRPLSSCQLEATVNAWKHDHGLSMEFDDIIVATALGGRRPAHPVSTASSIFRRPFRSSTNGVYPLRHRISSCRSTQSKMVSFVIPIASIG